MQLLMGGLSCPHVDYVMVQHEICPGAKKNLLSGCSLYRFSGGNNSGQGTGQQELCSEFCIQNPSQLWHDGGPNVLTLNVVSGAAKARVVMAMFNLPK